ncbi:hypothetical protein [Nostoc sp.]|uniref:hypothetical protein n=1 Tax=Nostoc sp. TaxID=1180 RepID=UPI002FFA113B
MPILYRQVVNQQYPVEVLINVEALERYFPDTGDYLLVFQIHQYQQINNEQLAIASLLQNLGRDFQLWQRSENFRCMSNPV